MNRRLSLGHNNAWRSHRARSLSQPIGFGTQSRGFIRLWQFRSLEDGAVAPVNRGPQWREPRLARLEAVLFLGREPLSSRKIAQLANLADGTEVRTLIRRLRRLYDAAGTAFQVQEVAGGYQLLTRPAFSPWLRRLVQATAEPRLSAPAMETLAVVAYRQPILRAEIESIRGVQCDDILRQLLERDLLRIVGRSEDLGRPLLYGTTKRFLELFGLRSLEELPRAAEFRADANPADGSTENSSTHHPGAGRVHETQTIDQTPEENSVTTRIRPVCEEAVDEPLATLLEMARRQTVAPLSAAADEDDADEEDEDEDDDDEEEWDDDDEEEDEADDDFVDDEWEEVDDDDADEDEDEEDDDEWEDDEDEDDDWDDDEDEDEVEDDDE